MNDNHVSWCAIDTFAGNYASPALLLYRPCPICESLRSREVWRIGNFQFYSDSSSAPKRTDVRVAQCLDCFALYLNPCYSSYGFQILSEEAGQSYGSSENRPSELVEWLRSRGLLQSGMQFMDVGCYDGRFLAGLPRDIRKVGVDIDQSAIEQGRKKYEAEGITFILGDLETFLCSDNPDVITMFHVLEHLPMPIVALKKLRSIAGEKTRLIVEVPVLENGGTNDINGFFSAMRMTHFSWNSLRRCLLQSGWRIVEKYDSLDYNGCRVVAEPSDEELIIDGNDNFMETNLLYQYLSKWYESLVAANRILERVSDINRFVIWGGGLHTEFLYHTTSFFHTNLKREYIIVDSDPMKHGKTWRGITIYDPSIITGLELADARLIVSSYGSQEEIKAAAYKLGIKPGEIVTLYEQIRRH